MSPGERRRPGASRSSFSPECGGPLSLREFGVRLRCSLREQRWAYEQMSKMLPEERCRERGARLSAGPVEHGQPCPELDLVCVCGRVSVHVCMCSPEQSILEVQWRLPASPDPAFGVRGSLQPLSLPPSCHKPAQSPGAGYRPPPQGRAEQWGHAFL